MADKKRVIPEQARRIIEALVSRELHEKYYGAHSIG